jgi:hypothetical protein
MKLRKRYWVAVAVLFGVVFVTAVWLLRRGGRDEADYGPRPDEPSTDLVADLQLMWQTANGASTPEAIYAAQRVFATVDLIGLARDDVIARLGDPQTSSDSRYNFPFYPAERGDLVYCFTNGAWGCQYNVLFGRDGKVRRVQYLAIE